ncbi:MAG: RDD family protein [Bacteroidetes bacterium HGW-Bacteroidetes-15]|nr:MAG: RDD family protein [Bacteroidetes bacterium HGW-Bacteroidetes-15]
MEKINDPNNSQLSYAGFWLRLAAYLVDWAILSVAGLFIAIPAIGAIVWFAIGFEHVHDPKDFLADGNLMKVGIIIGIVILLSLFSLVMGWLYYALMESSSYGGTVGKIAVGIKVTTMEGERVTFGRATGRYFARIITNLTFFIGYIMVAFTDKQQALHDMIASCLVIKKE